MLENTSRRSFVKGAAMGAAALGVAAVAGNTALADEAPEAADASGSYTYADTIAWDGEYDVIVLGFGGAGCWATLTAARNGANVLAVDKAPLGSEGGDFRVAGGVFLEYDNADDAYSFFKAQYQGIDIDEDQVRYFAQELTHTGDYLESVGIPREGFINAEETGNFCYYEYPGYQSRHMWCPHETKYDGYIFLSVRACCEEMSDQIDLWLESPAKRLIQAPDTGTILGAEIEHNGELLKIRAKNGVVVTTGGFVNNQDLMQQFLDMPMGVCMGSLYDEGDGIYMSMEVGADIWHTYAYDGPVTPWGGAMVPTPAGVMQADGGMFYIGAVNNGSVFAITDGGVRFMDETIKCDHGFITYGGAWRHPTWGSRNYMVMDEAGYEEVMVTHQYDNWLEYFVSGDTIEELAENIDVKPECLVQTVEDWATAIELGHDPVCGRDTETMRAWGDGPYYALPLYPGIHETRGGSRKNADMQVMGSNGEPIPHLYGAGECGSIYADVRSSGGSISECIIMGSLAGQKAAEEKDPLPAYTDGVPVASDLKYTIGSTPSDLIIEEVEYETADNEYIGTSENGRGGRLQLRVTIEDGEIKDIEVALENETPAIGGVALDTLIEEAMEAQSADINGVSGATLTSDAFKEALEDAMAQAGM